MQAIDSSRRVWWAGHREDRVRVEFLQTGFFKRFCSSETWWQEIKKALKKCLCVGKKLRRRKRLLCESLFFTEHFNIKQYHSDENILWQLQSRQTKHEKWNKCSFASKVWRKKSTNNLRNSIFWKIPLLAFLLRVGSEDGPLWTSLSLSEGNKICLSALKQWFPT